MTHLDERVKLLRHAWLFSGCSDDELSRIAGLATSHEAAVGDLLCTEGAPGDEFFGEMALIDGGDRTVTAVSPMAGMPFDS